MLRPFEQRFPFNLDWNLLRTFMVVVDRKGISRAADYLGLKQPTISSALKRLETAAGHKLIERKPNRFLVTKEGKILYDQCVEVFGSISRLPGLMASGDDGLNGHISVVSASHVVSPHLDKEIESFAERHGSVTWSFVVSESAEVIARIRRNQASLGICLLNEPLKNLDCRILFREYFGLYCGPRHRLFGKKKIALSDLKGEASVSFQTENERGPLDSVTHLRARTGLAPELKGVSPNLTEVRRMISTGIGIGALPVHVAQQDVERGNLWQLPPYSRLPAIDIYLVTNPRRVQSLPEAALIRMLDDMIERVPLDERTYTV